MQDIRVGSLRSLSAAGVFDLVPTLAEDLSARPAPQEPTLAFLNRLAASDTPEDALTFAAHSLSARHTVWWAHECLQARSDLLSDLDRKMLTYAATWVARCDEESRYAAMDEALPAPRVPGTWVALAAAWSGGSMAAPDLPVAPVPVFAVGRAAVTGVLMHLARFDLAQRRRWLAHFAGMAQALVRQG